MEQVEPTVEGLEQQKQQPLRFASPAGELSKSTDPLILDIKPEVEANNKGSEREATTETQDTNKTDESPRRERFYSQTHDGVFSNLSAKPEIMKLPKGPVDPDEADPPPAYRDTRYANQPRFMTLDERNLADSVDEVFLDDYEVGSVLAYMICVLVVLLFQVWGFLISFILSQSHAARLGSIGGLGLLMAFSSLSLQKEMERVVNPTLEPWVPIISLAMGVAGYLIFIYTITSFQRIRRTAEHMVSRPAGAQAPGIIQAV